MNRLFLLLIAFAGLLTSCHPTRKIAKPTVPVAPDTTGTVVITPSTAPNAKEDSAAFIRDVYQQIMAKHIDFTTFSGKIDMGYEDGNGNKFNGNAHVRMYKDSVIWISVTAILGIEGLRALITRDSVKILDKQNKSYKARSIDFLRDVTALPLDLPTLQDLLLGNPVFLDSSISAYTRSGNTITLQSNGAFFTNLFTVTEADKLPQSSRLSDIDVQKNRTCYLTYGDYKDKKTFIFPEKRTINVVDKVKLDLKLEYKQYDFNEKLSFPFSVPKNYDAN